MKKEKKMTEGRMVGIKEQRRGTKINIEIKRERESESECRTRNEENNN